MARLVLRGGRGPVAPPPAAVVGAHVRRALAQCGLDVGVHAAQGRGPGGNGRLLVGGEQRRGQVELPRVGPAIGPAARAGGVHQRHPVFKTGGKHATLPQVIRGG